MNLRVKYYIYKEGGNDWALVARRLQEVAPLLPWRVDTAVELGNAYLRPGMAHAPAALTHAPLLDKTMPMDAKVARQLRAQVAAIPTAGADVACVEPMRDPWLQ